jgi:hypothetical protein
MMERVWAIVSFMGSSFSVAPTRLVNDGGDQKFTVVSRHGCAIG